MMNGDMAETEVSEGTNKKYKPKLSFYKEPILMGMSLASYFESAGKDAK